MRHQKAPLEQYPRIICELSSEGVRTCVELLGDLIIAWSIYGEKSALGVYKASSCSAWSTNTRGNIITLNTAQSTYDLLRPN